MDITDLSASALSVAIHERRISCREVMQAYLERIQWVNPRFNAIINLQNPADLLQQADGRDVMLARGLTAFGDAFITGMLVAIFVAFRPQWLATYADRLYLPRS